MTRQKRVQLETSLLLPASEIRKGLTSGWAAQHHLDSYCFNWVKPEIGVLEHEKCRCQNV